MDSQLVKQVAIYYTFAMLRETLDFFLLRHEIMADPRLKHPLEALFLSELCPSQYESV